MYERRPAGLKAEQRRHVQVRRERTHAAVAGVAAERPERFVEPRGVLLYAPQRVVAGEFVRDLERPVARLQREQLAGGALESDVTRAHARRGGNRAQLGRA